MAFCMAVSMPGARIPGAEIQTFAEERELLDGGTSYSAGPHTSNDEEGAIFVPEEGYAGFNSDGPIGNESPARGSDNPTGNENAGPGSDNLMGNENDAPGSDDPMGNENIYSEPGDLTGNVTPEASPDQEAIPENDGETPDDLSESGGYDSVTDLISETDGSDPDINPSIDGSQPDITPDVDTAPDALPGSDNADPDALPGSDNADPDAVPNSEEPDPESDFGEAEELTDGDEGDLTDPDEDDELPDNEAEEYGGYCFSGYLEDGTPNFVWEGPGEPSEIGHELIMPQADENSSIYPAEGVVSHYSGEGVMPDDAPYPQETDDGPMVYSSEAVEDVNHDCEPKNLEAFLTSEKDAKKELYSSQIPDELSQTTSDTTASAADYSNPEVLNSSPVVLTSGTGSSSDEILSSPVVVSSPAVQELSMARAGSPSNYLKDTQGQQAYHAYRSMSDSTDTSMVDGIHTNADGRRRIYKDGKYFKNGAVALEGVSYYADSNGWLWKGWLKTISDESITNVSQIHSDDSFVYRYYDPSTDERLTGYQTVDGLGHFFILSTGIMSIDYARMIDGKYYYSDRYGICNEVKLSYGNKIMSQENQNNDSYLAKNMVNSVDINTFTGQNGAYSFRPRWYTDKTRLELFGFTPIETPQGYYCMIPDGSLKGHIGCIYRNVGRYKGREVDVRLTVTDYEFFYMNGDQEIGYFLVFKNQIGLNACNTRSITADMEFLDHETGQPVSVKGYATFSDIDISQSLTILSPVDEIFVDKNCVLYKDPGKLAFTAPFITSRDGSAVNDDNSEYWVQANYTGSHLKFCFGTAYEQYRFIDGSLINGESRYVWKSNYTGNANDYSIARSSGNLRQSWQGLHFHRLGKVSIPPITKTVSDSDETAVTENRLLRADETFEYTLSHNVPGESDRFFYSSYVVTDTVHTDLALQAGSFSVTNDQDADVSGRFDIRIQGQKITFTAKAAWLANEDFYDNTYHFHFSVKEKDTNVFKPFVESDYTVRNRGSVVFTRGGGSENAESNETITRYRIPYLSVAKKDSDTGALLEGAEFTIYSYDKAAGKYETTGKKLVYDTQKKRYESEGLILTEKNDKDGKGNHAFLLRETKVPEGYEDEGFEREIILTGSMTILEVTVENKPDTPPLGKIIITKRILESDIIWAHGNPVFLFAAEGTDIKGDPHRYEEFLQYTNGGYTLDGHGYAVLSLTIENVPIGTYDIYELPVIDYYLVQASAGTSNVTIHTTGPAARGRDPKDTAYGTGVLSKNALTCAITFTDKKGDDHGYRHTDVIRNNMPVTMS